MLNRRNFLKASGAGLLGLAAGFPRIDAAFAQEASPSSKVIPVANYIDPELSSGSTAPVGIAWVIGVDISGSISTSSNEYESQINALADAVERDDFRESIFQHAGPGSAALFVVDYDTQSKLQIPGVDFRENDPRKFRLVAERIRNIPRRSNGGTAHDAALQNAMLCFDQMPWDCDRKHVNIMTDGTGSPGNNIAAQRLLAQNYEAIISSLTTHISYQDIYAWCEENLTTPAGKYRRADGTFLPRGTTVEVATEMQTQSQDIGRYQDEVFMAIRKQILMQTAGLDMNMDRGIRYASASPVNTGRRNLFTAPFKNLS